MAGRTGGLVIGIIMAVIGVALIIVLGIITPAGMDLLDAMDWWASLIVGIGIAFLGTSFIFAYFKKPEMLDNMFKQKKKKYQNDIVDVEPDYPAGTTGKVKEPKKLKKTKYDKVI